MTVWNLAVLKSTVANSKTGPQQTHINRRNCSAAARRKDLHTMAVKQEIFAIGMNPHQYELERLVPLSENIEHCGDTVNPVCVAQHHTRENDEWNSNRAKRSQTTYGSCQVRSDIFHEHHHCVDRFRDLRACNSIEHVGRYWNNGFNISNLSMADDATPEDSKTEICLQNIINVFLIAVHTLEERVGFQ